MDTDDCEKVSRFLSEKLDELDPIEQNYYLEVSSPGMDRELLTPKHFEKFTGKLVEVKAVQRRRWQEALRRSFGRIGGWKRCNKR